MTNPGNAVGTNGGYGGRTSVNAFNDVLAAFTKPGIVQGWACVPKSGMTVALGGEAGVRDVAVAQNDLGQRTTINNISVQPVDVTLSDAPTLGQRIDAIVAYVTNPPDSNGQEIDAPDACGLIVVESSVTTSPTAPDEALIREAITADGGSGVSAYYVVLATIQVGTGINVITNSEITQGDAASPKADWPALKLNPKYMQVGTESISIMSPGAAGGASIIKYPIPFDNAPRVYTTLKTGSGTGASMTVLADTTEGFSALARFLAATNTTNSTFYWQAIDITQPPFIPA